MPKKAVKKNYHKEAQALPNTCDVNGMYISEMHIYPTKRKSDVLKAFVRLVLNEQLVLSSLRLLEGKNGLFVSYPGEFKKEDEKNYPYIIPLSSELRDYIRDTVIEEFVSQNPEYDRSISIGVEESRTNTMALA
jgi:stage V sporulation protein G